MKTTIKFPTNIVHTQYNSIIGSILISIIVVVIMLIMSHNIIDFEDSKLTSTLITGSVCLMIMAAIALSFSLKRTVFSSNGAPLICKEIEFKEIEYNKVKEVIADGRWLTLEDKIVKNATGIAMKVEFAYTNDKKFVAYQFFKYVPHSYVPCSDVIYLNIPNHIKVDNELSK